MGFFKKTIRDIELDGHTVLVRVDYNVPLNEDGTISDDLRIKASLPTLQALLDRGCKLVLISHLGRPEGKELKYSLEPVATRLTALLGRDVTFVDDCIGDVAFQAVHKAPAGSVLLLENLRFYAEEEADDHEFAKKIAAASQAAYFVQDGFAVVHRAHASTHAITLELPSVAGLLVEREYITITNAMAEPKRPLVAIMGGAKVSDKIDLIERFVDISDTILVGGAMANTILKYKGMNVGASKVEENQNETLDRLYEVARAKAGDNVDNYVILPSDVAVATEFKDTAARIVRNLDAVQENELALDIGDETIERYCQVIEAAGTVIWNGPVGVSEFKNFSHGSARLALSLATHPEIASIIGGGDTADFVLKWDVKKGGSFTHVSTGGGAGLELMAGKKLPGIESLLDA